MKIKIVNTKLEDNITFEFTENHLTEEIRQGVLDAVHLRGWQDKDCYSEVEE